MLYKTETPRLKPQRYPRLVKTRLKPRSWKLAAPVTFTDFRTTVAGACFHARRKRRFPACFANPVLIFVRIPAQRKHLLGNGAQTLQAVAFDVAVVLRL